jgi:hypothetical protein
MADDQFKQRNKIHLLRMLVEWADDYCRRLAELNSPDPYGIVPCWEHEEGLAVPAYHLCALSDELERQIAPHGKDAPPPTMVASVTDVRRFAAILRTQLARWNWEFLDKAEGRVHLIAKRLAYDEQFGTAYTQAVLAKQLHRDFVSQSQTIAITEAAKALGLRPLPVSREEAEQEVRAIRDARHWTPMLAKDPPAPLPEEYLELSQIALRIKNRLEVLEQAEQLEAARKRLAAGESDSDAGIIEPQSKPSMARQKAEGAELSPSREKAYRQSLHAIESKPAHIGETDRELYDWLKEHSESDDELPTFETWSLYVRVARRRYGTSKRSNREGRAGRSIVDESGESTLSADANARRQHRGK